MADTKTTSKGRPPATSALTARRAFSALVALLVLGGCKPVGAEVGPSVRSASPTSALPVLAVENLVTPETAGKPVLSLAFGEPVSVRKGGVALVLTPKSLAKLDGDPPDLSNSTTPGKS